MILATFLSFIMLIMPGAVAMRHAAADRVNAETYNAHPAAGGKPRALVESNFNLSDFGAIGDGVADDGPALQSALDALADAGGGTLFVPAGRYAINTPVYKDFGGLADSVSILGVESSTPVPPPTASGNELSRGLNLTSEFLPRTHEQNQAIVISRLKTFLIKDISFMGTPGVSTDALTTLAFSDVGNATIRHCEFYGLASLERGGSIVQAVRSHLTFERSVVLGSTCSSGVYASIIENVEWKGITVSEAVFIDYGQRPELYGKMQSAPFSWVSIGNAAAPDADSPRREAVFRSVFLDEGGFVGISSLTYRYGPPDSAPIDLLYINNLHMNVSNLGTTGHYLYGLERVMIEKTHYGWSRNTDGAMMLFSVGNAILDEIECVDSANRIRADEATGKLTVINSTYTHLDSLAHATKVITTTTPDEDPVQHVRQQFTTTLGRVPDAAAHFYWSNLILQCGDDAACVADERAALANYLGSTPAEKFGITGRVTNESGANLEGVAVTLSGSQAVTTTTDSAGQYHFSNLPTSGVYTVTPTLPHHTLSPSSRTISTPAGDQVFDSAASFNYHTISGRVVNTAGDPLADTTVTLSGSQTATVTTGADGNYSFADLPAGGNYSLAARKTSYTFLLKTFPDLSANHNQNLTGTLVTYTSSGVVVGINNNGIAGVVMTLSGWKNATTTSDSNGNFYFHGLESERDYTITPYYIEHSFSPSSQTFTNLNADRYSVFVATYTTHTVSGRVTETMSGDGVSGAVVTLSGYKTGATTTDTNGNYSFALPRHGTYTLTVAKPHYTLAQPAQTLTNLTTNQTANFTATLHRHNVTGRATAPDGSALAGVLVTLSGSQSSTATTDSNGGYNFASLPGGGNYTVKPSRTSYVFAPQTLTFNDLGANQTANFTGTFVTYKIDGKVTENTGALSGVSVLLSGSQTGTASTDSNGNYSFTLPSEGNYTITLAKEHYTFTPPTATFSKLAANETSNFTATRNRHPISGRVVGINNIGMPGILVGLSGSQTGTATTDSAGDYSFANLPAGGEYTVTPALQFHSFSPASQTFTNLAAARQASFVATLNTHTISGRLSDADGLPLAGAAVTLGSTPGSTTTFTTAADGNYSFGPLPAGISYVVSVAKKDYRFITASRSFSALNSNQTADFRAEPQSFLQFSHTSYSVSEGTAAITITVKRTGDTSGEATVSYAASNGSGIQGKDVSAVIGELVFAPGETSQSFTIFITDDSFVENAEQLVVNLSDVEGALLGSLASATLTINDNDSGTPTANPLDDPTFFVQQHYRDFLSREPDAEGLAFWSDQIRSCGTDAACKEVRRINVSAAFFLSIEFQETGFLVHRLYKAAFAKLPRHLDQFLFDSRTLSKDVVVNAPGWQQLLEDNKTAFINEFVERPEFTAQYSLSQTPAEFVNSLNTQAGAPLTTDDIAAAVAEFNGSATSADPLARARVLRRVAQSENFVKRETSPAFVLMQYFGYLQRNPSDPPNTNLDGYNFWLGKLNEFGGDFRRAEMVKAFLAASEYRNRFGL